MTNVNDILSEIKSEGMNLVKTEFLEYLKQAKGEGESIVKENANKIEQWLVQLANGEIDLEEFELLTKAQKRAMEQYLNTLEIRKRVLVEKITTGLIKLAVSKIAPFIPFKPC